MCFLAETRDENSYRKIIKFQRKNMNSFERHHKSGNQIKVYIVSTLKQKSVDLIEIIKKSIKNIH